jgi:hypothetical protein
MVAVPADADAEGVATAVMVDADWTVAENVMGLPSGSVKEIWVWGQPG